MADVTTSEIQNRITGLKAELDRLSFQLNTAQAAACEEKLPEPPALATEDPNDAAVQGDRERSLRTFRDLMWQGRWGLAFHLARALETQGNAECDFRSSMIRMWALTQEGRRLAGESLRLAEEVRQQAEAISDSRLAPRLLEWATRIGLTSGLGSSQAGILEEGYSPPAELPATCAWWRAYNETLRSSSNAAGKWVTLPDSQAAVSEVEELMLRGELEPIRLAASCLMLSIRKALRHVHVVSAASEQIVLNGELARTTQVQFTESGEVSSEAGVVKRAICELAGSASRDKAVKLTEVAGGTTQSRLLSAAEGNSSHTVAAAPMLRLHAVLAGDEAVPRTAASDVSEEAALKSTTAEAVQVARQTTARERLERYARRLSVQKSGAGLVVPQNNSAGAAEDHVVATTSAVSGAEAMFLPFPAPTNVVEEKPAGSGAASEERTQGDDLAPRPAGDRDNRGGIHEAALASAFGADGQRAVTSTVRPADGASLWAMLFNPQAAIVAALLVIAGAVIVGLGTGLAAKDVVEATTPAVEGVEASAEFAGDSPAMD